MSEGNNVSKGPEVVPDSGLRMPKVSGRNRILAALGAFALGAMQACTIDKSNDSITIVYNEGKDTADTGPEGCHADTAGETADTAGEDTGDTEDTAEGCDADTGAEGCASGGDTGSGVDTEDTGGDTEDTGAEGCDADTGAEGCASGGDTGGMEA